MSYASDALIDALGRDVDKLERENGQLKYENVKLRELVQQMYPIAKAYLQFGVMLGRIDGMSYDWALQMIELGVEVDE